MPARSAVRDSERAHKVHPITALETEYSLWSRDVEEAARDVHTSHRVPVTGELDRMTSRPTTHVQDPSPGR